MRLTLRKSELPDWYCIEKAEHENRHWVEADPGDDFESCHYSGRISDADVEGTAAEMLEIAKAIQARRYEVFRRCAVDARREPVLFRSPRNSRRDGESSFAEADALAVEILATLQPEETSS